MSIEKKERRSCNEQKGYTRCQRETLAQELEAYIQGDPELLCQEEEGVKPAPEIDGFAFYVPIMLEAQK